MTSRWVGIAGLLALLSQAHGQEIWRHVDSEGRVRYADRPFAGAVQVQPAGAAQWSAPAAAKPAQPPLAKDSQRVQAAAPAPKVVIAYPAGGATVWGAGGELEVRLVVTGGLPEDYRLSVWLDGKEADWQGQPPQLRLAQVWRGEHRLRARLLDAGGSELAVSEEVRFFKREPAVVSPDSANAAPS